MRFSSQNYDLLGETIVVIFVKLADFNKTEVSALPDKTECFIC